MPLQQAFPQVTPQDFQDVIASFHAFVATLTEHDAGADVGTSTGSATAASPTTPAEPAIGVPAGTPDRPVAGPIVPGPGRATDGDALLALACAALDTQRADHPEVARRTRSQLVVQVDPLSGWARLRDGDRRLEVHTADGVPVLHHPGQPWGDPTQLDPTGGIGAETLPPTHCDSRLDLGYAVSVLLQQAA